MLYESLCPSPLAARRGKGVLLEWARFYWTRCDMRSLTNVAHSSLFCVLPFIATTTKGPSTTTTAGRMQAEKHRSALRCRLRSTAPRCPEVPFRRQALSQETASCSTSHDREATGAIAAARTTVVRVPLPCTPTPCKVLRRHAEPEASALLPALPPPIR